MSCTTMAMECGSSPLEQAALQTRSSLLRLRQAESSAQRLMISASSLKCLISRNRWVVLVEMASSSRQSSSPDLSAFDVIVVRLEGVEPPLAYSFAEARADQLHLVLTEVDAAGLVDELSNKLVLGPGEILCYGNVHEAAPKRP